MLNINQIECEIQHAGEDIREDLRIAVISDAAPERNGVGAYYADLKNHLTTAICEIKIFSPTFTNENWQGSGFKIPLPGDATQNLYTQKVFSQATATEAGSTPGYYSNPWSLRSHWFKTCCRAESSSSDWLSYAL
jgi:hypothetical protein